jgi:hypothetical protein
MTLCIDVEGVMYSRVDRPAEVDRVIYPGIKSESSEYL